MAPTAPCHASQPTCDACPVLCAGTCDVNSIFVTYEGSATNLGEYHSHRPTHHTSNFQGCNLIKFNDDRTKIKEIIGGWWWVVVKPGPRVGQDAMGAAGERRACSGGGEVACRLACGKPGLLTGPAGEAHSLQRC